MEYKLVDNRNTAYISDKSELYNIEEILLSIRETARFSTVWNSLFLGIFVLICISMLYKLLEIMFSNIEGNSIAFGLLLSTLPISGIIFFGYMIAKNFDWHKTVRDKQIIKNLRTDGKITLGVVTEISEGILHYSYQFGNDTLNGKFFTDKWANFEVGDEVAVLHVYKIASCLL